MTKFVIPVTAFSGTEQIRTAIRLPENMMANLASPPSDISTERFTANIGHEVSHGIFSRAFETVRAYVADEEPAF